MKLARAVRREGRRAARAARRRARRLRGAASRSRCSCRTCRRIRATSSVVPDVRSELAIPLLLKDRCIGVVDLESPELDAFSKRDVEILTLLASQAAVAIENARLYEEVRANEERLEKEVRFAQRVQIGAAAGRAAEAAQGRRGRGRVRAGARARRRLPRLPGARVEHARRRRRRRLGQGRAGGALQRVCRRARARPHVPPPLPAGALEPGGRAVVDQHDPAPAPARGVLLHALLRDLRSEAAHDDAGELGPAVSDPLLGRGRARRSSCRACRSDRSRDRPTTRSTFALHAGDVFVFCTDGVFEAMNAHGQEFTAARLLDVVERIARAAAARRSSRRSSHAVAEWRGDTPPNDDMTAVAVRITA